MSTYRIQAAALLRLAAIAATAPGSDAAEILGIVQGAEPDGVDHDPAGDDHAVEGGPTPPVKPEE